jgi:hypothetical protein
MVNYWGYDQEEKALGNAGRELTYLAKIAIMGGFKPGAKEKLLRKRRKK